MIQDSRIKEFTDLKAWQEARKLAVLIYRITRTYPKEEIYSLVNQMQRAAVSIASNIAEGFGRQTLKEKIQFYYQAQGSLTELKNQIIISQDISYLSPPLAEQVMNQVITTHKLLQGLIRKTKTFIK